MGISKAIAQFVLRAGVVLTVLGGLFSGFLSSAAAATYAPPYSELVVDARTGKVLHGRRFIVSEDAATQVGDESLRVDTANYALAPGVRALGLRFHNEGRRPAAADGWWNDELMLLVPEGRALRPVFCQPLMAQRTLFNLPLKKPLSTCMEKNFKVI